MGIGADERPCEILGARGLRGKIPRLEFGGESVFSRASGPDLKLNIIASFIPLLSMRFTSLACIITEAK